MAKSSDGCLRCCLLVYLIVFWVLGLGCIAVGLWMKADPNVIAWFTILRRNPQDELLSAAAVVLIIAGIVLIGIGVLGFIGMTKRSRTLLGLYCFSLVAILIMQVTVGFMVVAFREQIHLYVKNGMKQQIANDYEWENGPGRAWNWVQVKLKCCGADGSWDYRGSSYQHSMNPGIELEDQYTKYVPKTCCVLNFNEDRDVTRVDPQDCHPKDEIKCQEDAAGNKDGSDFLQGRGCFAATLDFIYDHIHILIVLGVVIGSSQVIGIILAYLMMRRVSEDDLEK